MREWSAGTPPKVTEGALEATERQGLLVPRASSLALLVFGEAGEVTSYRLPETGVVEVGRAPEATFQLLDRSISRFHARFSLSRTGDDTVVTIEDLGSANGSRVAGEPLAAGQKRTIIPGQPLELGRVPALLQRVPMSDPLSPPARDRAQEPSAGRSDGRPTLTPPSRAVSSPKMKELYRLAERIARSSLDVLLLGETGVGKEDLAEYVHAHSPRQGKTFLRLNCAALPEPLLESELFGHVRGAFTGADQTKRGVLEAADGGTVLLDEVGELPLGIQAKLLRVVERRELMAVGSLTAKTVDLRFISATNRDLEREIQSGKFRADLYHRLNGVTLTVPPLRERSTEIEDLALLFARAALVKAGSHREPRFTPAAKERLLSHLWPGNVRELKHAIERAVVLAEGPLIDVEHLALAGTSSAAPHAPTPGSSGPEEPEAREILVALEQAGGNQARAAKALGISRGTLATRMDRFGIARPRKPTQKA